MFRVIQWITTKSVTHRFTWDIFSKWQVMLGASTSNFTGVFKHRVLILSICCPRISQTSWMFILINFIPLLHFKLQWVPTHSIVSYRCTSICLENCTCFGMAAFTPSLSICSTRAKGFMVSSFVGWWIAASSWNPVVQLLLVLEVFMGTCLSQPHEAIIVWYLKLRSTSSSLAFFNL